jgi:hypothetical protein
MAKVIFVLRHVYGIAGANRRRETRPELLGCERQHRGPIRLK